MLFAKLFQSRIVFRKKDSCLYYVMLIYINVLGIEGPNYVIFYKINKPVIRSSVTNFDHPILLIRFHY